MHLDLCVQLWGTPAALQRAQDECECHSLPTQTALPG